MSYFIELEQNPQTCGLRAISQRPTDWSAWGGLWTPCAGAHQSQIQPHWESRCPQEQDMSIILRPNNHPISASTRIHDHH